MERIRHISSFIAASGLILILVLPLLGLPVAVPGIPVWYQDSFFLALICGGGVGLSSILFYFTGVFRKVHWNVVDWMVLVVIIYSLIRLSFQEFEPHTSSIKILFFGGLYFLGRILFTQLNQKSINLLIAVVLLAGIGESVYGLGQLYGVWKSHHSAFPITGSFFNPGPYSGWLALIFPLAIWILYNHNKSSTFHRAIKVASWCFLFLTSGVLIVTMSRAAWLAVAGGSLFLLWGVIRKHANTHKYVLRWGFPLASVLIVSMLVGIYFLKKDSAQGRLLIYKVSTEMIADYPLFGVGFDRFPVMYPRYQAYYFDAGRGSEEEAYLAGYVEYPFNEVLGWISEMGLVGFLLIVLILGILMKMWNRRKTNSALHPFQILAGTVLLTWLIFSLFSYPMEVPVSALSGVLIFSALATTLTVRKEKKTLRKISPVLGALSLFLIGGMAFYSLRWSHINWSLSQTWISANANYQLARYNEANDIYKNELWPSLQNEGDYLQMAGKSLFMARQLYPSAYYLERSLYFSSDPVIYTTLGQDYTLIGKVEPSKYDRAEFLLKVAKYIQPGGYYPRYLLLKLFAKTEQQDKQREEANAMLSLKIKVASTAVDEMRAEARDIVEQDLYKIKLK